MLPEKTQQEEGWPRPRPAPNTSRGVPHWAPPRP